MSWYNSPDLSRNIFRNQDMQDEGLHGHKLIKGINGQSVDERIILKCMYGNRLIET